MHASWTYRLRFFIKKHLLMFFCWRWLAVDPESGGRRLHQCSMDLRGGEVATIQHMEMMAQPGPHYAAGASPLCEKHCAGSGTKDPAQPHLVALPAAMTLTLTTPECSSASHSAWSVTPPAVGAAGNDPATAGFGSKTC